ncbi:universal stress protein [Brevibacterium sediminis]|uniref:universal stress protein n=1 Tax=Brevibacterium sediminis TaxID=1857024 RepID=UPI00366D1334
MTVLCVVNDSDLGVEVLRLGHLAAESTGQPLIVAAVERTRHPKTPDAEVVFLAEHQDESDAVLDLAAEHDASLIVIGVRRRSPVGKFLLGSAAQKIILEAPIPVLTAKEPIRG